MTILIFAPYLSRYVRPIVFLALDQMSLELIRFLSLSCSKPAKPTLLPCASFALFVVCLFAFKPDLSSWTAIPMRCHIIIVSVNPQDTMLVSRIYLLAISYVLPFFTQQRFQMPFTTPCTYAVNYPSFHFHKRVFRGTRATHPSPLPVSHASFISPIEEVDSLEPI